MTSRPFLASLAIALTLTHACAQSASVPWIGGKAVGPGNPLPISGGGPCACTPLSPGQYNLAITTSTALTPPSGATYAVVVAEVANIRYTIDGTTTPTASVGKLLTPGASISLWSAAEIAAFRAISATGTIGVDYAK